MSHGVIVTAPTMDEAVYKSVLFERTCMLHWLVQAMDRTPVPIAPTAPEAAARRRWSSGPPRCTGTASCARSSRDEPDVLDARRWRSRSRSSRRKQGFTTAERGQVSWLPEPERAAALATP